MNEKKVSTKREANKTEALMAKYGIYVSLAVLLVLYFMPLPNGMTEVGQKSLAIFLFALIMWVTKPIPIYLTSLIAILILPLTGAVESTKVAFGTLGFEVIWLMVAAFVLTSAMNQTNLGKRFALNMVTKYGRTPKALLAVLVVVNFALAFFVPSTTARASLLVPIVLILLEIYQALPGESKFGKLLMLQGVQNNHFATSMIMTATSGQVIAIGFINEMTGASLGYMDWLIGSMPQAILTAVVMFIIGLKIFKPETLASDMKAVNGRMTSQLAELGAMTTREKKAAAYFALTLFLWATGDYQKALLGFELGTTQVAVLSMVLMLMPKIGVIEWKEANIKWDLMLFSAGAYAVGNALNDSGGATWVIDGLVNRIGLDLLPHSVVAVVLIFISVFSHIIFTSKTVRTTILIPATVTLAVSLGMEPVPIALAVAFGIAYTTTLPPHSKVNTLYFSTGYFSVLEQLLFGLLASFVGSVMISLVYFLWLPIIL
ncbi:MAG: DASS family sodium-coupled anion symporter [Erysipelothrix sp.]|nr:DASS family sodium-coupled anion symporter [Erysipelothrix sp.]